MRIAILSDVHSNIAALDAVLDDIARRGIHQIVNLGDSLSGPFDAVATASRLMSLNIPTISGNHDRALWDRPRAEMGLWEEWVVGELSSETFEWLRALPKTISLDDVLLCHATPSSDEENWLDYRGAQNRLVARDLGAVMDRLGDTDARVVCAGHTHTPRIVRLPAGQMIVNPGSVGCPAYLDTRSDPPFIHETGSPDARYAIIEDTQEGWTGDLVSVPYDSAPMAKLARAKGADSWAQAVETGWITGEG